MIKEYCRALSICLFGIVALLLSTKLEEVARFIALGASSGKIILFVLYQIPYILQIAVPLSSLVAGFTVLSTMSSNGELTAARSSGYSLSSILAPICLLSFVIGILMMWGMFDLSARSHLAAKELEFDVREEEPLAFVQNSRFLAEHCVALELTGSIRTGEDAKDLLVCLTSPGSDRLSLVILKKAHAETKALLGNSMSVISSRTPQIPNQQFGSLVIENADAKKTPTDFIHELTQKRHWKPGPDQFTMSVVRAKQRDLSQQVAVREYKGHSAKKLKKLLHKCASEPYRRLSLSLAVFSLCLSGAVTGIRTSRGSHRLLHAAGPLLAFGLFIAAYLAGKNLDDVAPAAIFFYLIPHPILWKFATTLKTRLEHGMEY
jgi:lipopolysaccharide export system permease protein